MATTICDNLLNTTRAQVLPGPASGRVPFHEEGISNRFLVSRALRSYLTRCDEDKIIGFSTDVSFYDMILSFETNVRASERRESQYQARKQVVLCSCGLFASGKTRFRSKFQGMKFRSALRLRGNSATIAVAAF